MPLPNDTRHAAWELIERCGNAASLVAANHVETLRKRGDTESYAAWVRIVELVTEYRKRTPSIGDARH